MILKQSNLSYLCEKQRDRKAETETNLPLTGSLPKCTEPGLRQDEARIRDLNPGFPLWESHSIICCHPE